MIVEQYSMLLIQISATTMKCPRYVSITECTVLVLIFQMCFVQALFKHLPQQRRLSVEEKKEAARLLDLKANKKLVQHQMSHKTGKVILLKDLSNVSLR